MNLPPAKPRDQVEQEIKQVFGFVPEFYRVMPDRGLPATWALHRDFELPATAIDNKHKELIGLAVAAHIKCRYCIYFHTQAAKAFGANDEEVKEAILMGGLTVAFSNSVTGGQVDYEAFKKEVDRAIEALSGDGAAKAPPQPHHH